MRFTTTILLSILFCWGVSSCQKREEKTFTVKIYNPVTDEPYEDIYVAIAERTNTTDGYVTEEFLFFEGYTDASGELTITGEFHKRYAYQLLTGSPEGVTICEITAKHQGRNSGAALQLDNKNLEGSTAYVELTPCAELKLDIKNTNCIDNTDKIVFDANPLDNNSNNVFSPIEEYGCFQSQFPFNQVPSGRWKAEWEVTKNGVVNNYDSIFFINENEQYILEINY